MTLAVGSRLGPYEVLAPLGAGGMGEVYRARDSRLDRTVAVKILPPRFAESTEMRQRFEREARAISSLSHPYICALYDVGNQDGTEYLVMEYLEGQTLATRIAKGPLPLDQSLRTAIEIASALEAAHRAGIVHRDLKPGNVMLTKSGVKLVDFGLAKATPNAPVAASDLTRAPTQAAASHPLTERGTLLGTFKYMSPEQLVGAPADARSDIFAFGAVLYEMATGRRAFEAKSQPSLIAAILDRDPEPLSSAAPMIPPALDRLIRKCLAKDPEERWQSAADLKSELQWIAEAGAQAGPSGADRRSIVAIGRVARAVSLVALGLGAGVLVARTLRPPSGARGVVRFALSAPTGNVLETSDYAGRPAISADGRAIAFVARGGTRTQTSAWVRTLDSLEAKPVAGTDGVVGVFWSPDGQSLGIIADRKWKRVALSGGNPQTLCDAADVSWGASWGASGNVLFVPFYGSGLQAVPAEGGTPALATSLDASRNEVAHLWPMFLPDGKRFLFFARTRRGEDNREGWICVASLGSKEVKRLRAADAFVGASRDRLFFTIEGTLQAQRFDPVALTLGGEPRLVPGRVLHQGEVAAALASVSWDGVLAFRSDAQPLRQLFFFDRSGKRLEPAGPPGPYEETLRLSPDGRRVAVVGRNPRTSRKELWLVDIARGTAVRLGDGKDEELKPVWSPDGKGLLFSRDTEGNYDFSERAVDGSRADETVLASPFDKLAYDWSRDGKNVLYWSGDPKATGLWVLPRRGDANPSPARGGSPFDNQGQFAPDGRFILLSSAESGRAEIYVRRFPEGTSKVQISIEGGRHPRWRGDGREIFFISPDGTLMAASWAERGERAEASLPMPLFAVPKDHTEHELSYDVTADGRRFLMITPPADQDPPAITVLLGWEAEGRP